MVVLTKSRQSRPPSRRMEEIEEVTRVGLSNQLTLT